MTKERAAAPDVSGPLLSLASEHVMPKHRRRTGHETIRASITIDVATYARWSAAAALARVDRSEFAVNAIAEACRGLFLTDRRKTADRVKLSDRPDEAPLISPDAPDDAA